MRSYRLAQGRRRACIRAHWQNADTMTHRHKYPAGTQACAGQAKPSSPPFGRTCSIRVGLDRRCLLAALFSPRLREGLQARGRRREQDLRAQSKLRRLPWLPCRMLLAHDRQWSLLLRPRCKRYRRQEQLVRAADVRRCADPRPTVCDTGDRARYPTGATWLLSRCVCVMCAMHSRPLACPRARVPVCIHLSTYPYIGAFSQHPFRLAIRASINLEIRPPSLQSSLPGLLCVLPGCDVDALRNASAAPAAAPAAADTQLANGVLPTPHFLTLSCYGPGCQGSRRGRV
jgi:hypothetical protein